MKTYDNDYVNECIKDLEAIRNFFEFMTFGIGGSPKIDCILELLKDYKGLK